MKNKSIIIFAVLMQLISIFQTASAYTDERGHNLDSLERVAAVWTADNISSAKIEKKLEIYNTYYELMLGYEAISSEKAVYYARKARSVCFPERWPEENSEAAQHIGLYFYAKNEADSALFWFRESLAWADRMILGGSSPTHPNGYDEKTVDNIRSQLYGAIGNLYSNSDNISEALNWYSKAEEIFTKYNWNESNSVLHYNLGETWACDGEYAKAAESYNEAVRYAEVAGDSLLMVNAFKGLGSLYMQRKMPWKSLTYLQKAEDYYSAHPDEKPSFRTENLEYMQYVLSCQKRQIAIILAVIVALVVLSSCLWTVFRRRKAGGRIAEGGDSDNTAKNGISNDKVIVSENEKSSLSSELTDREKTILELLAQGFTTAQIAERVYLSIETIRWYRKKLLAKFDVSNTPELVSKAKEMGLI